MWVRVGLWLKNPPFIFISSDLHFFLQALSSFFTFLTSYLLNFSTTKSKNEPPDTAFCSRNWTGRQFLYFGRGGGPPGFFGPGGGTGLELLFSADVREEIELIEDQEDQLRELGGQMRDEMRSMFGELRDLPPDERREAMQARMEGQRERVKQELANILLDHQMERLEQLQLQARLQRGGAADALGSAEIREKLGLTDDQLGRSVVPAERDVQGVLVVPEAHLGRLARCRALDGILLQEVGHRYDALPGGIVETPVDHRRGGVQRGRRHLLDRLCDGRYGHERREQADA